MQETTTNHEKLALEEYPQWVAWEYREQGKRKVPISPHTWGVADATNPETWSTYDEALLCAGSGKQVGFVFSDNDPFTGIDLDGCINLETGEIAPWADRIIAALNSYTEFSPSGTGLKIWVRASKPGDACRTGSIEIYDRGRFFAFTGKQFGPQSKVQDRQEQLERLYQELFRKEESTDKDLHGGVDDGDGFGGNDAELLAKARNANGTGKLFSRLYDNGDTSMYSYDDSRADMALCGMLAYWSGKDSERMDRLFRSSRLMRKKWGSRRGSSTYGEQTIARAIKGCRKVYDPNYRADTNELQKRLAGCLDLTLTGSWDGRSGPTDRDVYKALIDTGVEYGRIVKDGIEVSASLRDLALESGVGRHATVSDALRRLDDSRDLIRKIKDGGRTKASTYLIRLTQNRAINNRVNKYGTHSSQAQKIRNPGQTYGTVGKRNGQIIDYVRALGRTVSLEELAKHLGIRKNNLKKRNLRLLLQLELLKEVDGGYVTPTDIEDRLQHELKESGQLEAEKVQRERYERERAAWRERDKSNPTVSIPMNSAEPEFHEQELVA
jgi:putative DNA primase/helicase